MADKMKELTIEDRLAAQEAQTDKLLEALAITQKQLEAAQAKNTTEVKEEAPAPTFVRAKTSSITLEAEGKTIKITISPNLVETGFISIKGKFKTGDTDTKLHRVKIDDALAKNVSTGKQTDFSLKCLAYILANPKSVQWTVETV